MGIIKVLGGTRPPPPNAGATGATCGGDGLLWNDPALGIQWPIDEAPQLSAKDQAGKLLRDAELFP